MQPVLLNQTGEIEITQIEAHYVHIPYFWYKYEFLYQFLCIDKLSDMLMEALIEGLLGVSVDRSQLSDEVILAAALNGDKPTVEKMLKSKKSLVSYSCPMLSKTSVSKPLDQQK